MASDFNKNIGSISPTIVKPVSQVDKREPDTQTAKNIKAVGDAIVSIKQSYQGGELKGEVERSIQDYLQGNDTNLQGDLTTDIEQANAAENLAELEGDEEEDGFAIEAYSTPIVQAANADAQRLTNANASGALSRSDMKIRTHAMMRDYINSAPRFAKHFRQILAQTLGDYKPSIDAKHAAQISANKQAAAQKKAIVAMGQKHNIDPNLINQDWNEYTNQVSDIVVDAQAADQRKRRVDAKKENVDDQQREVVRVFNKNTDYEYLSSSRRIQRIIEDGQFSPSQKKELIDNKPELDYLKNRMELDKIQFEDDFYRNNPEARSLEVMTQKLGFQFKPQHSKDAVKVYAKLMNGLANINLDSNGSSSTVKGSEEDVRVKREYYRQSRKLLSEWKEGSPMTADHQRGLFDSVIKGWDADMLQSDEDIDQFARFVASKEGHQSLQRLAVVDKSPKAEKILFNFDQFVSTRWGPNLNAVLKKTLERSDEEDTTTVGDATDIVIEPKTGRISFKWNETVGSTKSFTPFAKQQIDYLNREVAPRFNTIAFAKAHLDNAVSPDYMGASQYFYEILFPAPKPKKKK